MAELPLSVAHFTNAIVRGGAEEHILMLLRGLDRRRFRPYLICPPKLLKLVRPDLPNDVQTLPILVDSPMHVRGILRLLGALRRERIDILHSHMFTSSLYASPLGRAAGVPVIIETAHGRESWRHGLIKGRFFVDRLVGRFVDCYIAVSHANARYLIERKRLSSEKICVIHPGCDVSRFTPNHPRPNDLKAKFGFSETDDIILFVGRLEPQKGHTVLLDAMPRVLQRCPSARLVCAGEGGLRPTLEAKTNALGLTSAVRFLGYPRDLRDWLAVAAITVLPSFFEGLPATAIESLAAGRTMVATAVDGTPEVIVDGRTGLTVPPGDPIRLADAICTLLEDRELREKLAANGRDSVVEEFAVERLIERTESLYLEAWECRKRRRQRSGVPQEQSECAHL